MNKEKAVKEFGNALNSHINELARLLDIIYNPPKKHTLYDLVKNHKSKK